MPYWHYTCVIQWIGKCHRTWLQTGRKRSWLTSYRAVAGDDGISKGEGAAPAASAGGGRMVYESVIFNFR
jgi:hypothetical protein